MFILIQESQAKDKRDYIFLENAFKKYEWITNNFNQNKCGLAIGVKKMKLRGEVQKIDCEERHGGALAIQTWVAGEKYCALNIYRHSEMFISQVLRICNQSFSKQSINILGGNFNFEKNQPEFQTTMKAAARHRMFWLEGDFVTHYHGRTINHLFIPNSYPKDWCFIIIVLLSSLFCPPASRASCLISTFKRVLGLEKKDKVLNFLKRTWSSHSLLKPNKAFEPVFHSLQVSQAWETCNGLGDLQWPGRPAMSGRQAQRPCLVSEDCGNSKFF